MLYYYYSDSAMFHRRWDGTKILHEKIERTDRLYTL